MVMTLSLGSIVTLSCIPTGWKALELERRSARDGAQRHGALRGQVNAGPVLLLYTLRQLLPEALALGAPQQRLQTRPLLPTHEQTPKVRLRKSGSISMPQTSTELSGPAARQRQDGGSSVDDQAQSDRAMGCVRTSSCWSSASACLSFALLASS